MKYKVNVIKKIAFLVMTMALAVAMVACSGAAGTPGPAGPPGEQGAPGTPAEPGDPTTEPQPGDSPVDTIKDMYTFRFNDPADGGYDKEPQMMDVSQFFHPKTGLKYMPDGLSANAKKYFDVQLSEEDGMLTVTPMKADTTYMNHMFKVKAVSPNGTSDESTISVRRNQPPRSGGLIDAKLIWVTSAEKEIKEEKAEGGVEMPAAVTARGEVIYIALDGKKLTGSAVPLDRVASDNAHFLDDPGNTLSFESAPMLPSLREKLMVTGGKGKIVLQGMKSTWDTGTTADVRIPVKLSAKDDGELSLSADPVEVFSVAVDTAPEKVGAIGFKSIELGVGADTVSLTIVINVTSYFMDDRAPKERLEYSAQSDNTDAVVVSGNPDNKKDISLGTVTGTEASGDAVLALKVDVKGRGMATITVKAKEPVAAANPGAENGANKGQEIVQEFVVEVK
jgi:hypothetical protein